MKTKAKKTIIGGSIAVAALAMAALFAANAAFGAETPSQAYINKMMAEARQMGYDAGAKGPIPKGEQDFLKEEGKNNHYLLNKPYQIHDPDYPELTDRLNEAFWDGYFPDSAGLTFTPTCADYVCNIDIRW